MRVRVHANSERQKFPLPPHLPYLLGCRGRKTTLSLVREWRAKEIGAPGKETSAFEMVLSPASKQMICTFTA